MRAGNIDTRVTFRRKTISYPDGNNEAIVTWADAFTTWAGVITEGGKEYYAAQKLNAETSAVFKIRFNGTVNTRMRIKLGTQEYHIIAINNVGMKNKELRISAREVK